MIIRIFAASVPTKPLNDAQMRGAFLYIYVLLSKYANGKITALSEKLVREFVLQKLNSGLSTKTVKDILIVLKMVMKFGVKNVHPNMEQKKRCITKMFKFLGK